MVASNLLFEGPVAEPVKTPSPGALRAVRRPVATRVARLEAEKHFQRGRERLAAESWASAASAFREAARLHPETCEYLLHAAWAEFHEARPDTDFAEQRAQLRNLAERALAENAEIALAHLVRGHLATVEQDDAKAELSFERVLRIEPSNLAAQRYLQVLQRRRAPPRDVHRGEKRPERSMPRRPTKASPEDQRQAERLLERVEIARTSGDLASALEGAHRAVELDPKNARATAELALALLLSDPQANAREANRLAREARAVDGTLALPYVVLGVLMEEIREPVKAAQLYEHALSRDADCTEARRRLEQLEAKGKEK